MDAVANLDAMVLNEEDFLDFETMIAEDLSAYEHPILLDGWKQKSIVEPFFITSEHSDWDESDPRLYIRRFWFNMDDILDFSQPSSATDSKQVQVIPGTSSRTPSFRSEASGQTLKMPLISDLGAVLPSEKVKLYLQNGLYPYYDTAGKFKVIRVINTQNVPHSFQQASFVDYSNPFDNPFVEVLQTQPSAIFRKEAGSTAGVQLWHAVRSDNGPSTSSKNAHYNSVVPQTAAKLLCDFTVGVPRRQKILYDKTKTIPKTMLFKNAKPEAQNKDGLRLPLSFKNNPPLIDYEDSDSDVEVVDVVTLPESYRGKVPESSPNARCYSKKPSKQKLCSKSSDLSMEKENFLEKNSMTLRI